MNEHRRSHRKGSREVILVSNSMTGDTVGRIGNLSADGLMLVANRGFGDDALFQFQFSLATEGVSSRPRRIEIGVHALWCEAARSPGSWWAGFRIIDISEEDQTVLETWLDSAESSLA